MALADDLKNKIDAYGRGKFDIQETEIVPDAENNRLTFGNTGLVGEYSFLFVDIRKSSSMVGTYGFEKTAKILQSFHDINVRVILTNNGEIRSFDGDRVMGVFAGTSKINNSVKAAMQIQYGIRKLLNPILNVSIKCGAGIDYGKALISKVGKGANINNNDVLWIGRATNYASHLCNEANDCVIISPEVYERLLEDRKYSNGVLMWMPLELPLKTGNKIKCYTSGYQWRID